jgi:hypothetical protein
MAKEAASRSLDYSLSGDILDRVARAGETIQPKVGLGDAISSVGKTVQEFGEEKVEERTVGEEKWDVGFDKMGDRGSWASGELFDQFQQSEAGFKEPYLEAIRSGDKKTAGKLLKDQQTRASQLQTWKELMGTAKEINEGVGWSNSLTKEEQDALGAIAGGGVPMSYNANNEMVFKVNGRDWTRREVDDMVGDGAYAHDVDLDILKDNSRFQQHGLNNGLFDLETQKGVHQSALKQSPNKVKHILHNDVPGLGSFRDHFRDELTARLSHLDPTPEDGMLRNSVFTEEDINAVFKRWEENPAEAAEYQAEWLALSNKRQYDLGKGEAARSSSVKTFNSSSKAYVSAVNEVVGGAWDGEPLSTEQSNAVAAIMAQNRK